MSPEEEAQVRYLMRKGKQLPMPIRHLLKSVSGPRPKYVERMPSIRQQSEEMKALTKRKKKKEDGRLY